MKTMRTLKAIPIENQAIPSELINKLEDATGWEKTENGVYNDWYQHRWAFHYESEEMSIINLSKKYPDFKLVLEDPNYTVIYYQGQVIQN